MNVNITTRNFNASDQLKERIDKKFQRLDKYFSREIVAYVMLSNEKGSLQKLEATINAGGMIFRAEEVNIDIYYCLDKVVDRLSSQMSRFKTKMVKRHKDQKEILFAHVPDAQETHEEFKVARTKRFAIQPGEKCIIAEDVVTTGISSLETKRVIEEAGGICLGITCVVDRTKPEAPSPIPILASALKLDLPNYAPEECPICKEGKLPLVHLGSRKMKQEAKQTL